MTDVVRIAIDAELAKIVRVVAAPVAPFGYGTDISCREDLAEDLHEVEGFELLGEAIVRRLDTPRGSLPDDPSYGISLSEYLNRGTTATGLREIASKIRGELRKDDRVADVAVPPPETSLDGSRMRVSITVTPVDARVGPFDMTLAVTSAGVVLEAMGRKS